MSNYTPDVRVGNPSRFTSGLIKASLGAGVAWFGYQLANEIAAHQSILNQSPVATIAFLALALTVAAYVAMRQQAGTWPSRPRFDPNKSWAGPSRRPDWGAPSKKLPMPS